MKIEKLTGVARTDELMNNYKETEAFLGREIESARTMKVGKENARYIIDPGTNKYLFIRYFRPFSMVNNLVSFDGVTGIMVVRGRDKWQRNMTRKTFQFEKVGYKTKTTRMPEGWIWGNPVEVEF